MTQAPQETRSAPTAGHEAFLRQRLFANLDGLRGVSILLVLLHHTTPLPEGPWRTFQENGFLGVPVFFAISGFLIITLLLREEDRSSRIALLKFFGRRAVRLLPAYYLTLAIYCVMILKLQLVDEARTELFRERLPGYFAYYSNLVLPLGGPFSHSWSLAYEEQFYLLFGLLMAFMARRILTAVTVLIGVLYLAPALGLDPGRWFLLRMLTFFPASIIHGVVLAFWLHSAAGYNLSARLIRPWVAQLFLLLVLGFLFVPDLPSRPAFSALHFLCVALLVFSCVLQGPLMLIGGRAFSYLGKISYGIYLQHVLCKHVVVKLVGEERPLLLLAGMLVLSLFVAHLSYQYFETPLIRRFSSHLAPAVPQ